MSLLDIVLAGLVLLALDIDVALYQSSRVQAAEQDRQEVLVNSVIVIEFVLRLSALALVLFVLGDADQPLFEVFGVSITTTGLMMLAAGAFLFFSSSIELGEYLAGPAEEESGTAGKTMSLPRLIVEMSLVSLFISVDAVVAIFAITDRLAEGAAILLIATLIRWLVVRGFASYMRRNPSLQFVATNFLILVGITLILQGVQIDFPVEAFGLGVLAAITAQLVYKQRSEAKRSRAEASNASGQEG